jgi:hypothetical protein
VFRRLRFDENLTISINLKVIGSGATTTIVDGGRADAVFTISSATANVSLSMLTMRHGSISAINNIGTLTINASAITNSYTGGTGGGGVLNNGVLTISDSVISGNIAPSGGGIFNIGALTINKSTISGNSANVGGGIVNWSGILKINNSTISQNDAKIDCLFVTRGCAVGSGGGIYNLGTVTITNSTIAENSANGGNGGGIIGGILRINNSTISQNGASQVCFLGRCYGGSGGGIWSAATTLQNSIVAHNLKGGNCSDTITSHGYNMSSDGTCNFHNSGDRNNTNPMLGTLGNYGGPTQTIPLLSGSPAIDAGNPSGCTDGSGHLLTTDQRGYSPSRPGGHQGLRHGSV